MSDNSTHDVTSQVVWSSASDEATIANDNLGPNKHGQTRLSLDATSGDMITITATLGSLSDTSTLNVGAFAYVANGNSDNLSAFIIDPTSGALTSVTGSPFATSDGPRTVTVDPSGRLVYVTCLGDPPASVPGVSAFTIDPITGSLTLIGNLATGDAPYSVTVDPGGRFAYIANYGGGVLAFTIDPTTGALTSAGSSPRGAASTSVVTTP